MTNRREPRPFDFELTPNGRLLVVRVNSRKFDTSLSNLFRGEIDRVWSPGITDVSIDFTNVEMIDSAGVGALINVHKRFPPPGKKPIDPSHQPVTIINAAPAVLTIIELLQLHRVFKLVRS
jgi:anti-anti-sigma regulatory factor